MLIRILMKKMGSMMFLSHLELMKTLERSFKAAGVVMDHSKGFNPRPLMQFALPLAVGVEAKELILEVELLEDNDFSQVVLPRGLEILDYKEVEKGPSLMSRVGQARYRIEGDLDKLRGLEEGASLVYERRNKRGRVNVRDARDFILDYKKEDDAYIFLLKAGSQANLKPTELLEVILEDKEDVHSYDIILEKIFDLEGESLW